MFRLLAYSKSANRIIQGILYIYTTKNCSGNVYGYREGTCN
jgi:hypothetical protein